MDIQHYIFHSIIQFPNKSNKRGVPFGKLELNYKADYIDTGLFGRVCRSVFL